jgi:uncharacterized protein
MSPFSNKHLIALLVLSAASLPLAPIAALAHDDEPPKRTITISGKGTVKTAPDMVTISAGVESQAPTAKEALLKNTAAMTKVVETLKSEGIDPKDIQTTNVSVSPRYEDRDDVRPARIVGYAVYNTVYVTMHDTAKLGGVLDQLVSAGANSIGGISFGLDKPEALQNDARKLAMSDAIAKAKLYAEAAGAELGPVQTISEQGGYVPRYAPAPMMEAASKAVPIEPGTEKIEIEVQVTWELKQS